MRHDLQTEASSSRYPQLFFIPTPGEGTMLQVVAAGALLKTLTLPR